MKECMAPAFSLWEFRQRRTFRIGAKVYFCKAYGRSFPKVVKMCRILAFPRRQHVVDTFALQIS
jgi:hypothetical protein